MKNKINGKINDRKIPLTKLLLIESLKFGFFKSRYIEKIEFDKIKNNEMKKLIKKLSKSIALLKYKTKQVINNDKVDIKNGTHSLARTCLK